MSDLLRSYPGSYLKSFLKFMLPLISPFIFLSFCSGLFQVSPYLIDEGVCFSILLSLILTVRLKNVRFWVNFRSRTYYLKNLTFTLKCRDCVLKRKDGFLYTFESADPHWGHYEINVYLFTDRALINAPKCLKSLFLNPFPSPGLPHSSPNLKLKKETQKTPRISATKNKPRLT